MAPTRAGWLWFPACSDSISPKLPALTRAGSELAETPLRRPALAGTRRGRAGILVPEVDAALVEVVRGHLDSEFVAGQDADAVLLHAARGIGDHFMPIVELHAAARVGQHLGDNAFEFQHLFLGHALS